MNTIRPTLLVLVLTAAMVTVAGMTASASPGPGVSHDAQVVQVAQVAQGNQARSVELLGRQVMLAKQAMSLGADGHINFDAGQAVAVGADPIFVRGFAAGVSSPTIAASLAACGGVNRYISHWWGPEGWFDSCVSDNLSILLTGGAALSTVIGAILVLSGLGAPAGAIVVLATGLLGLGSVAVRWCNREGTGIKAFKPVVGPFICTTQ